jgi:hypothetical protein
MPTGSRRRSSSRHYRKERKGDDRRDRRDQLDRGRDPNRFHAIHLYLVGPALAQESRGAEREDHDEDQGHEDVAPRIGDVVGEQVFQDPQDQTPIIAPGMFPMPPRMVAVKALGRRPSPW